MKLVPDEDLPQANESPPDDRRWPAILLHAALAAMAYLGFATAEILLSRQPGSNAQLHYAAAAWAVVAIAWRPMHWPSLLMGFGIADLLGNALAGDGSHDFAILLANLTQAALSAYLLGKDEALDPCMSDVVVLLRKLFAGGIVPALLGALVGAAAQSADVDFSSALWIDRFEGSALGAFSILPLAFVALTRGAAVVTASLKSPKVLCALLVAALLALASPYIAFPFVYVAMGILLTVATGQFAGAAMAVLLCSLIFDVLLSRGLLQAVPDWSGFRAEQFYLPVALTFLPTILFAAAMEGRRETLERLALREDHYRTLYERTPGMLQSSDRDGRIVSVSDGWLERLGYELHEVLGRESIAFLAPESKRFVVQTLVPQFIREGTLRNVPMQMLTRSGESVDVILSSIWERDVQGRPIRTLSTFKDVSEERRLAARLEAEQELVETTLSAMRDGIVTTDALGSITFLNPVAEDFVGWTLAEAKGQPFSTVVHLFDQSTGKVLADPVRQCLADGRAVRLPATTMLRNRGGSIFAVRDTVEPILGKDDGPIGTVLIFNNVSGTRAFVQKMSSLVHYDSLTGLPNRALFQDRLLHACADARRDGGQVAVALIDLDHFKHVNESLGPAIGDCLLQAVAERLRHGISAEETVGRLGGDEFAILLTDVAGTAAVADLARQTLDRIAEAYSMSGTDLTVTASIGIAIFPDDGHDADELMKYADTALYRAKRDGRNRHHFFSHTVDRAAAARLHLESAIRRDLAQGRFVAHYQPIIDAQSFEVCGAEALARWSRADQGLAGPDTFIDVAEQSGLIVLLGEAILAQACAQLRVWHGTPLERLSVAVNVSPVQLADPEFVSKVERALFDSGASPERLTLEITESPMMHDAEANLATIQRIKALGIAISIDDFGTGYSSLSYLRRFPVDVVKIDRSFIQDIVTSDDARELVRAIVAMANALRIRVVAEGVETAAQAGILSQMRCSALQGYLYAKPADARTTTDWIQTRSPSDLRERL